MQIIIFAYGRRIYIYACKYINFLCQSFRHYISYNAREILEAYLQFTQLFIAFATEIRH